MAIVMDFISRNGAHVIVRDDCYRDCTPEEIERRRAEVVRAMEFIALRNAQLTAEARRKETGGTRR